MSLRQDEETLYRRKCKELRRRITATETSNNALAVRLARTKRGIQRLRLERAFLYETLEARTPKRLPQDESDATPSPPVSPKMEPLPAVGSPIVHATSLAFAPSNGQGMATTGPKGKPVKDPFAPKRPTNPFLHFCESERERIRAETPNTGEPGELTKALGAAWQQLDEKGRKPYIEMYEADRARYEREKEDYLANGGDSMLDL